jgi:hypothetical protein
MTKHASSSQAGLASIAAPAPRRNRYTGQCAHTDAQHAVAGSPDEWACDECGAEWINFDTALVEQAARLIDEMSGHAFSVNELGALTEATLYELTARLAEADARIAARKVAR